MDIKYNFDALDLHFILDVQREVLNKNKEVSDSTFNWFFQRLENDPKYVYHYDEKYWATVLIGKDIGDDVEIPERYRSSD
ncbi:hypothetical protein [Halobacillus litoralis]|uniref:hypothetical protein n=1 Tax=Halobacillus litoralis TaxID=45668 RepID=UPI001CD49F2F|nr:hypothetical protein [Halobacillus litoralis]MCA1021526.1 hypothetical protein [Halobacillus litoralis]